MTPDQQAARLEQATEQAAPVSAAQEPSTLAVYGCAALIVAVFVLVVAVASTIPLI